MCLPILEYFVYKYVLDTCLCFSLIQSGNEIRNLNRSMTRDSLNIHNLLKHNHSFVAALVDYLLGISTSIHFLFFSLFRSSILFYMLFFAIITV